MCFETKDIWGDGERAPSGDRQEGYVAWDDPDALAERDAQCQARKEASHAARMEAQEHQAINYEEAAKPAPDFSRYPHWYHQQVLEPHEQWKARIKARYKDLRPLGIYDASDCLRMLSMKEFTRPRPHAVFLPQEAECVLYPLSFNGAPRNDMGNATRFWQLYAQYAKYCTLWRQWLIWDGQRWWKDESNRILSLATQAVETMEELAKEWPDEHEDDKKWRKQLFHHAKVSGSAAALENMVKLAGVKLAVHPDELDADRWVFNCENGTIDLRTGELKEHDPADCLTKLAPVEYRPNAKSELWDSFLEQITENDEQLADLLQELAGYFLTGSTREHIFPVFWGEGRNGKGVLLDTLMAVMGDYGATTSVETFLKKPTGSIPNDLAALKGARLVIASESEEGQKLATGLIKRVTGEDPIAARFLNKEWFEYQPTYKPVLVTNHLPNVPADDKAFWRRAMLIPFTYVVPEGEEDKALRQKLQHPEHLQAVLTWAVEGCLRWQDEGFTYCKRVTDATAQYREDVDWFSSWLYGCCIVDPGNDEVRATPTELLESYNGWAKRSGAPQLSPKDFAEALRRRHIHKKGSNGKDTYRGIRLKELHEYWKRPDVPVPNKDTDAGPKDRAGEHSKESDHVQQPDVHAARGREETGHLHNQALATGEGGLSAPSDSRRPEVQRRGPDEGDPGAQALDLDQGGRVSPEGSRP